MRIAPLCGFASSRCSGVRVSVLEITTSAKRAALPLAPPTASTSPASARTPCRKITPPPPPPPPPPQPGWNGAQTAIADGPRERSRPAVTSVRRDAAADPDLLAGREHDAASARASTAGTAAPAAEGTLAASAPAASAATAASSGGANPDSSVGSASVPRGRCPVLADEVVAVTGAPGRPGRLPDRCGSGGARYAISVVPDPARTAVSAPAPGTPDGNAPPAPPEHRWLRRRRAHPQHPCPPVRRLCRPADPASRRRRWTRTPLPRGVRSRERIAAWRRARR